MEWIDERYTDYTGTEMRIIWSRMKNQNSRKAEWGKTVFNRAVIAVCFLLTVLSPEGHIKYKPIC